MPGDADFAALFDIRDERLRWFNACIITLRTIEAAADQLETKKQVRAVLERLAPDPAHGFLRDFYSHGIEHFGDAWRFLDARCVLTAYARLARPRRYLEIGVRNGMSLCLVAAARPTVDIAAFDLFQPGYGGMAQLGPEHVRAEVAKFGHAGKLDLIAGDSHETVPTYLREHPETTFDLVFVDGDHSAGGARADLEAVAAALSYGGLIVFDDISNPNCRGLLEVWREFVAGREELVATDHIDGGNGVAFALKTNARPT
jgi:predicted O-methyltransferase YrrM